VCTFLQSSASIAGWAAALVGLLAISVGELATADSGFGSDSQRVSAAVSISDLDLTTTAGAQAARNRISKLALRLCRQFSDSRRISDRETVADCERQAVQEALRQTSNASPKQQGADFDAAPGRRIRK
jgi:UrcA family protein